MKERREERDLFVREKRDLIFFCEVAGVERWGCGKAKSVSERGDTG